MNLTIFDLDNTLLSGDSDYAWGQFLVHKGLVDKDHYSRENERFYRQYQDKTLDIHEYQQFVLAPLMDLSVSERDQLHREFMETVVETLKLPKALRLIEQHKSNGDQLLIITATNRFIAGPIGPWLGIDQILATELETIDGQFTGRISGTPCFQEGKITRLQQWLQEKWQQEEWLQEHTLRPEHIRFYSDSINDLPLLEYADSAVAVDPDERLRSYAEHAGWSIISLRQD
ncbi:MAG: HAD family phosphatase [Pseudomonadota bacterium]